MFWPRQKLDQVTVKVKHFYETTPFPNYEGIESPADLVRKAKAGGFAEFLDKLIPFNSQVLDAGCGTGQLPNFLSLSARQVFGTDMSLASLKLAQEFKARNELKRASFYQMNIFRPIFKPKSFDVVICMGVLHHTLDPQKGFTSLSRLVKPGGLIIIGLYHRFSRMVHFSCHWLGINRRLAQIKDQDKRRAWFEDQYHHPHESTHTVSEVSRWFGQAGFEVIEVLPQTMFQFFLTGVREGGLFVMIGKKK